MYVGAASNFIAAKNHDIHFGDNLPELPRGPFSNCGRVGAQFFFVDLMNMFSFSLLHISCYLLVRDSLLCRTHSEHMRDQPREFPMIRDTITATSSRAHRVRKFLILKRNVT